VPGVRAVTRIRSPSSATSSTTSGAPPARRARVDSLIRVVDLLDTEIDQFHRTTSKRLRPDPGYKAIMKIPGVGPVFAAVLVAKIGDITCFERRGRLTCCAGLTPPCESDTTVRRGPITKQGSRLVRWAAVEAVQRAGASSRFGARRDRIAARRGQRSAGVVSAARDLLTLVFYGLRDHQIRALTPRPVTPAEAACPPQSWPARCPRLS
jgi:transposase